MDDAPVEPGTRAPDLGARRLARGLGLGVLLGLVVYALLLFWGDASGAAEALGELPWWAPAAACALSFANYVVRFPRWSRYLRLVGARLGPRDSFRVYLAGLALTVSPGKMGEALKSWLVRELDGTPIARTAPIVLAERLTDLLGFLVIIAVAGLTTEYDWVFHGTLVGCALLLTALWWRTLGAVCVDLLGRLPLVGALAPRLAEALESTRVLLAPRELPLATLLAAAGWSLECVGAWIVADALLPGALPFATVAWAFALAAVAGAVVVVVPGGLGVTEGLYAALLEREAHASRAVALGADAIRAKAAAATLVTRLCTLWFAMAIGLVALASHRRRVRR